MNAIHFSHSLPSIWRFLKRQSFWLITFFLVACFTKPALAQFTAPEEQQSPNITTGVITEVEFRGNHALSSDELSTVVSTKATSGFSHELHAVSFKLLGSDYETLSQPALQRDTAALNQYYHNHGFIEAKSSYQVIPNRDDLHNYFEYIRRERLTKTPGQSTGTLPAVRDTVVFTLDEGRPFTISHISIEGLESLPNEFQTELNDKTTIHKGERWSLTAAASEVQRIVNILIQSGYPNVRSDTTKVQWQPDSGTVRVLLYIHPGHRYKYGPVRIVYDSTYNNKSTIDRNVILAQLYIDSGHWYKLSEIQRSESALNKLGMFDLYRVSLDTNFINLLPDSLRDSAAVPVEVFLRMKGLGQAPVGLFGGESTQGFVLGATVGLTFRNLLHLADFLNIQGSLQPFPPSLFRYNGNIDYVLPYIGFGRMPLILGAGYSHQIQTQLPATDTSVSISFHVGSLKILSRADDKTTLSPDFLIAYVHTQSQDPLVLSQEPLQQINLIPSISYQDNRTNDLINPTSGNIPNASFEMGIPSDLFLVGHSSYYYKGVFQLKNYFDFSNNGTFVLATRVQLGATYIPNPDTNQYPSLDRRFYGGGSISNRGWAEQSLLVSANPNQVATDGGFNDLEGNIELRFAPFQYPAEFTSWQKFSSDIRLVLFYDIGNVWDNVLWSKNSSASFQLNGQALNFNMLAESIGIGLRYNMFFGALRIDWGFKLYDPTGQFINTAAAIVPGQVHGQWLFSSHHPFSLSNVSAFHFGIGQAF